MEQTTKKHFDYDAMLQTKLREILRVNSREWAVERSAHEKRMFLLCYRTVIIKTPNCTGKTTWAIEFVKNPDNNAVLLYGADSKIPVKEQLGLNDDRCTPALTPTLKTGLRYVIVDAENELKVPAATDTLYDQLVHLNDPSVVIVVLQTANKKSDTDV